MEKERRIEKLLRAFAKKRKADAGAPLELHPATRRLLQDEVARGAKRTSREGPSLWKILFGTTPRRAFVVCALITLFVNALIFLPTLNRPKSQMTLAGGKNETRKQLAESESPALQLQPATPPPPAPVTTVMPSQQLARKDVGLKTDRESILSDLPASDAGALAYQFEPAAVTNGLPAFALNTTAREEPPQTFRSDAGDVRFKDTVDHGTATTSGLLAGNRKSVGDKAGFGGGAYTTSGEVKQMLDDTKTSSMSLVSTNLYAEGAMRFKNADKSVAQRQVALQRFYRMRTVDELNDVKEKSRDLELAKAQQKPVAGEVLDSFAVEQYGDQITVVDSDGSRYSGTVQLTSVQNENQPATTRLGTDSDALTQMTPTRRAIVPGAATGSVAPAASATTTLGAVVVQNYAFLVVGTNLTSKQPVTFSGNFVAITNTPAEADGKATNAIVGAGFRLLFNSQEPSLQNSRIVGRAVVGAKPEIEINATPVAP